MSIGSEIYMAKYSSCSPTVTVWCDVRTNLSLDRGQMMWITESAKVVK